jgi:hypothetical protein
MRTLRVSSLVAQRHGLLGEYHCEHPLQYPCMYSVSPRAGGRPRRSFGANSLDGTIPAALSALNSLAILCACPARNAAPCAAVRAPCHSVALPRA